MIEQALPERRGILGGHGVCEIELPQENKLLCPGIGVFYILSHHTLHYVLLA